MGEYAVWHDEQRMKEAFFPLPPLLQAFQDGLQSVDILVCGSPTGDEATDGAVIIIRFPMNEQDFPLQKSHHLVGKNNELLIGGRVDVKAHPRLLKHPSESSRHLYGMA